MNDSRAPGRTVGRAVYVAVAVFYGLLFAALVWPVYPRFATIEPRVLAMPHSLAYVVGGVILSFVVLTLLFVLEGSGEPGADPYSREPGADGEGTSGVTER